MTVIELYTKCSVIISAYVLVYEGHYGEVDIDTGSCSMNRNLIDGKVQKGILERGNSMYKGNMAITGEYYFGKPQVPNRNNFYSS